MRQSLVWNALAIIALAACGGGDAAEDAADTEAAATPSPEETAVESLRQATTKYEDVNVALAEGYIQDPSGMCVEAKMMGLPEGTGSMGVHYLRPDLLGMSPPADPAARVNGADPAIVESSPEVLVYEPQADGTFKLVAAEYLVFEKAWKDAGNTAPPSFAGTPFVHMADDPATPADEAHHFEPHYELHVWLYRDNPTGRFAEWNPNVSCAHGKTTM